MFIGMFAPYVLTDQGFVFKFHDPSLDQFPESWRQELSTPANWHDDLAFGMVESQSLTLLNFSDVLTIAVSVSAKTIDLWPSASLTQEALRHLLINQLVPRIYAAQGKLVLHAGAVVVGNQAIALMGKSGAGKSTLTASLHLQGAKLLNDDAVVISKLNDKFLAGATHSGLRLLPDSLCELFSDMYGSTPVSQFNSKRRVAMADGKRHEKSEYDLGALFFIGNQDVKRVSLRKLDPVESVMAIIANSFALNPTEPNFAIANLSRACVLAEGVPAYELNYPRYYQYLSHVHQAIFRKLGELRA